MAGDAFRKDLGHLSWAEIYGRQALREPLMEAWMDAARLEPGNRVLEVGSGPGFVTLALAERVGRKGVVYAMDVSADALAYLERLQTERGLTQIRRIHADASASEPADRAVSAAFVTMVLHHADDPAGILRGTAAWLAPGMRLVIGEFDPEGPCEKGPPREHRIAPDRIRGWCEAAGLATLELRSQSAEHYMLVMERRG